MFPPQPAFNTPRFPAAVFRARSVHAAGAFSLATYLGLAAVNRADGADLWTLWACGAAAWAGLLAAWPSAKAVRPRALILWAAAFHIAGIWGGPLLEDDYHRYLWDGYRFAQDGTPYGAPPSGFFADPGVPDSMRGHLDQVNHPDLPTIYGPLAQFLFLAGYVLAPGEVWPLQVLLSAANLGVMVLLALARAPVAALLFYAWNPLVIIETAFMAHPDILAAALGLTAWLALRGNRPAATGALLATACASRLVFILAAPLILARAGARGWIAWLVVLAAIYGPFLASGATELSVLLVFAQQWQFNAGLFALLASALGDTTARISALAATVMLVLAMVSWLRRESSETAMPTALVLALALPLLLGPVVNAWYLIWLLPLAALSGFRFAPWAASAAVLLAYGTRFNLGWAPVEDYQQPTGLLLLEHGLIWAAVSYEAFRLRRNRNATTIGKPSCVT